MSRARRAYLLIGLATAGVLAAVFACSHYAGFGPAGGSGIAGPRETAPGDGWVDPNTPLKSVRLASGPSQTGFSIGYEGTAYSVLYGVWETPSGEIRRKFPMIIVPELDRYKIVTYYDRDPPIVELRAEGGKVKRTTATGEGVYLVQAEPFEVRRVREAWPDECFLEPGKAERYVRNVLATPQERDP